MSANQFLSAREREILSGACVGVAGAGGLGSNAAAHLVRAGVGRLVVVDFDVVSESNLNRQFYFRDQLGRPKVEALAENLRRIDPDARLETLALRLDGENSPRVFAGCDVVIEAFDKAEAKSMLLRAIRDKPLVCATGLAGWGRSERVRLRRVGARLVVIGDCESGVGGDVYPQSARVGIAAAMEANAAIALLLGVEP